jgi:hypothetical protein
LTVASSGREDSIPPRIETDRVAGAQIAASRRVDFDGAPTEQGDLGPLYRTKRSNVPNRAFENAGAGRTNGHIVAPNKQLAGA